MNGGSIESGSNPLAELEEKEKTLWRAVEREITERGMHLARKNVSDAMALLDSVEDFRAGARVVADAIRQLTMIIRQEILIKEPAIQVDALAAKVDDILGEKIEFHLGPHTQPDTSTTLAK